MDQDPGYFISMTLLRAHPLFKHLNSEQQDHILLNKITDTFKRGSIIYEEDHRMKGFYWVQKGILKIFKTGFDGKEQIIKFARPGDIIGYRSVISNEPACTTVEVLEESTLSLISAEILLDLVRSNGDFAVEMMKLSCKELDEANEYLTDIAQKTVRERLAEIIIHLDDEFGINDEGFLNISLTREELSNIVGTATESIIRLLAEFRDRGFIVLKGRKIKILDGPGLRKIAGL